MMENSQATTIEKQPEDKRIFRDTLLWGFIIGLITPFLAFIAYYYAKIAPNSWSDFFRFLAIEKRLLSSMTVICLIPNIALFTIFINTRKDQIAKGIFGVTLVFAIASLLVKFLG
jgi:magnesium-transporting ATPase (P-type)